jgi:alpha-tubulin suppressor-like RCC1 family protein
MTKRRISRREALTLLSTVPMATSFLTAQGRQAGRRVFPGTTHAFILEPDGTLKAWTTLAEYGNDQGELGLGHNTIVPPFALYSVPGLSNVIQVAAGDYFSFARQRNGRILAWGMNTMGVLGTTVPEKFAKNMVRTEDAHAPTPLGVAFEANDISVYRSFALAAARDGRAYAWGQGTYGRLGIGQLPAIRAGTNPPRQLADVPYPIRLPGLEGVTAVAAGSQHGLALLEDGTVRAWGYNVVGEVGDGTVIQRTAPVPVLGIRNAVAIGAGSSFSVALLADGTLMTWGGNPDGELARRISGNEPNPIPARAEGVTGVRAIAVGVSHVLALTDAGTVMSWGENGHSATGNGTGGPVPKLVPGLTRVQSISTIFSRSFAVLSDGQIMAWGDGLKRWARLNGDKTISPFPRPLEVDGLNG